MSYKNWTDELEVLSEIDWYDTRQFRKVLLKCQRINFSIVAERQVARDALVGLELHEDLFSQVDRFPEDNFYFNQFDGSFPKLFQMIFSALDYKEGDKDPKKPGNATKPAPTDREIEMEKPWNFNDASQQYRNALREFEIALRTRENVFNRPSFEKAYHLKWVISDGDGTLQDLIDSDCFMATLSNNLFLVGDTGLRLASETWPTAANVVLFEDSNKDMRLRNNSDSVFLWSVHRVTNNRTRIQYNFILKRVMKFESIGTAD